MSERLKKYIDKQKNKVIKEFHFLLMLSFGLFFLKSKKRKFDNSRIFKNYFNFK